MLDHNLQIRSPVWPGAERNGSRHGPADTSEQTHGARTLENLRESERAVRTHRSFLGEIECADQAYSNVLRVGRKPRHFAADTDQSCGIALLQSDAQFRCWTACFNL